MQQERGGEGPLERARAPVKAITAIPVSLYRAGQKTALGRDELRHFACGSLPAPLPSLDIGHLSRRQAAHDAAPVIRQD